MYTYYDETTGKEKFFECAEDGCGVANATVGPCEWCGKVVCGEEHLDVLSDRDIDSDLLLCHPCGDEYDRQRKLEIEEPEPRLAAAG